MAKVHLFTTIGNKYGKHTMPNVKNTKNLLFVVLFLIVFQYALKQISGYHQDWYLYQQHQYPRFCPHITINLG